MGGLQITRTTAVLGHASSSIASSGLSARISSVNLLLVYLK